jgi:hypothetical protein
MELQKNTFSTYVYNLKIICANISKKRFQGVIFESYLARKRKVL